MQVALLQSVLKFQVLETREFQKLNWNDSLDHIAKTNTKTTCAASEFIAIFVATEVLKRYFYFEMKSYYLPKIIVCACFDRLVLK